MATVDRLTGFSISVAMKPACVVAATTAITLYGTQTIDGIAVQSNDRVLVPYQTSAPECGIYLVNSATWTRTGDCNGARDVMPGTLVYVDRGTAHQRTIWTFNSSSTLQSLRVGTDDITLSLTTIAIAGISPYMSGTVLPVTSSAALLATIGAVASSDAILTAATNVFAMAQQMSTSCYIDGPVYHRSTSNSSNASPITQTLKQSTAPANNDELASHEWVGRNSAAADTTYVRAYGQIVDKTSGSEDGQMVFETKEASVLRKCVTLGQGVMVGGATEPGDGSIAATGAVYVEGGRELEKRWKYLPGVSIKSTTFSSVTITTGLPDGLLDLEISIFGAQRSGGGAVIGVRVGTSDGALSGVYPSHGRSFLSGAYYNQDSTISLITGTTIESGVMYVRGALSRVSSGGFWWNWESFGYDTGGPCSMGGEGLLTSTAELKSIYVDTSSTTQFFSTGIAYIRYR